MPISALPLTRDRMPDLDALFGARGCSLARNCYCMYYRSASGDFGHDYGGTVSAKKRRALAKLAEADPPPGLIGYQDGQPVGWVALGPRADFARLANSPTMRAVDTAPVWSIVCFVVPSEHRKQGVAHELLAAAIAFARQHGARQLEAYPVDRDDAAARDAPWFGSLSMFAKAGFVEVARHKPARPIVRRKLTPVRRGRG
jgi:GNAT superfamily N-acetyltransferase